MSNSFYFAVKRLFFATIFNMKSLNQMENIKRLDLTFLQMKKITRGRKYGFIEMFNEIIGKFTER